MGSTQMNRDSSRSHTMFSLSIQYQTKIFRQGKLNFVDLGNFSLRKSSVHRNF